MKFISKKKENEQAFKRIGKAQPDFADAKPEGIDFAAPSIIKELRPGEKSAENVTVNDYMVEIGATVEPARYYRSFYAELTGGSTWGGMLDTLSLGEFGEGDMDLAIHVRPADSQRELQDITRRIAGLRADMALEGNESKRDSMQDEIDDLKERQRRIRMNIESSFRVIIQVLASGTDLKKFRKYVNTMVKMFGSKGIILKSADGNQLEALQSVLLTSSKKTENHKEHFLTLETSNLADLFPFGQGGISHRSGIIIGKDILDRPVFLDGWHSSLTSQHMVVMGRTGAGKTYTVMEIVLRSTLTGIRHAIVDWKGEYKEMLMYLGLPFIELSQQSKDRINPYDVEVTTDIDGTQYVDIEEATNAVQALVFKMISTYDREALTGTVKVFIGQFIRQQYEEMGITKDPSSLYESADSGGKFALQGRYKDMPTLSGLYEKMANMYDDPEIKKAAELLKPFTQYGNSPSYAIFDGQSTVNIGDAPLFAFAINKLDSEIMKPIGLFAVTRWLSERFSKKNINQKKRIVIEECQNIFNDPDVGSVWAESSYRESRSTNTSICAVTQGLEVFTRSQAGIAAVKNSPIKIIGKQESLDIDSVKGKLDLSEGEANFLVSQAKKGWVVLKVDEESTILRVDASEMEHMLFTTDPNDPALYRRKEVLREKMATKESATEEAS